MQKVHLAPLWSVVVGTAGLAVISRFSVLSLLGWCAGLLYLGVSCALLTRGLRRRGTTGFGPANAITLTRSTVVGLITALVATSFTATISVPLLIGLTVPALALDAADGFVARRTHTISELGARFDMEVDAFLILVLSVYVSHLVGAWVLAIGLARYAFAVAGWVWAWMRQPLPYRYWRKVTAGVQGVVLTVAAAEVVAQRVVTAALLVALLLLVESFGRDVIWLWMRRRPGSVAQSTALGQVEASGSLSERVR